MWTRAISTGVTALVLAASGCSSSDSASEDSPDSPDPAPASEELFVGECGSMADDQMEAITGIPGIRSVSKNAIRCRWEADGSGAYTMFTWYRGSPIDRERTVAARFGRDIGVIDVEGHPGFTAKGSDASCEAGVESGDGFLHWTVNYAFVTPPRDSCDVVAELARATVANAR